MKDEKNLTSAGEDESGAKMPNIRSEYSYLFEDNDEDPYEQIYRRVESTRDEEENGGMPVNKDTAVASLFEETEVSAEENRKVLKFGEQIVEALKKLPFFARSKRSEARFYEWEQSESPEKSEQVQPEASSLTTEFAQPKEEKTAEEPDKTCAAPEEESGMVDIMSMGNYGQMQTECAEVQPAAEDENSTAEEPPVERPIDDGEVSDYAAPGKRYLDDPAEPDEEPVIGDIFSAMADKGNDAESGWDFGKTEELPKVEQEETAEEADANVAEEEPVTEEPAAEEASEEITPEPAGQAEIAEVPAEDTAQNVGTETPVADVTIPEEATDEESAVIPEETAEENDPVEQGQRSSEESGESEPPAPPPPLCVKWAEDTFRQHREKELLIEPEEDAYAPVEAEYYRIAKPIRKKKKREQFRQRMRDTAKAVKDSAVESAVRLRNQTVNGAKAVAHALKPSVVRAKAYQVMTSAADTATYRNCAITQMIVAGMCGALLAALLVINHFDIPTAMELSQYKVPVLFAGIHAGAMALAVLLSFRTAVGGAASLFSKKFDRGTDGLVSLLMWVCLLQCVLSIFFNNEILRGEVSLYAPVCMMVLFTDAWGKLLIHKRIRQTEQMLDAAPQIESAGMLREDTSLQALVDETVPERLTVILHNELDRKEFLDHAIQPDGGQKLLRTLTLPMAAVAVLIGALEFAVTQSWMGALASCAAVLCVCAPASAALCMSVPILRGAKKMAKYGAAVASWEGISAFGEVGCVAIKDELLYPENAMELINVKIIRSALVETAVISAAAVLHQAGGPMCRIFDRIITGEAGALPKAEQVQTEENGGVTGWINGCRVIVGKGDVLLKYGIQPPSKDYEKKNCPEDKQFMYLAYAGELAAMFIMDYTADPEVKEAVQTLSYTGCDVAVCASDANMTKPFLLECFDLDEDALELIPAAKITDAVTPDTEGSNQLAVTGGSRSLFHGLAVCIRLKSAIEVASALQLAGVILGILLMVVFSATGAIYQVNNIMVGLFELFWLTASVLIPALKKI